VEISVARRPNRVVVRVIADGPGITPEDATALTEDPEQTPLFHGNGLGLWLVRWIVTQSRGTVRTHQHDEGGTVVEIELQRQGGPEAGEGLGPANDRGVGNLD
jgi:C4-dicarboxylate-specific signal transduction histidine kinase